MSIKIELKNFKRIRKKISITNLSFVNYLVGRNSAGKSSIINGISFLNDPTNARRFFNETSVNRLSYNDLFRQLKWNPDNPNKVENEGNLNLKLYSLISNYENEKGANNIVKIKFDSLIGINDNNSLEKFNSFLNEIEHCNLTAKRYFDQSDPFSVDRGTLVFESELGNVDPTMIADGIRVLYNFKNFLQKWVIEEQTPGIKIILIEEPEINLHPDYQKLVPKLLNNLYEEIDLSLREKIFFIISTHSPFIIGSASNYNNQKVFPLEDGKLVKINFKNHSWELCDESEGYSGFQCVNIVNKMLGADIVDIGYPENYCILEEYSLQIILDNLKNRGIIKNIQFISFSGVEKSLSIADKINELEKLNTLIKCNPYYFDKYFIVVDNTNDMNPKVKLRVEKLKQKMGKRFIELTKNSLEDYYVNISESISYNALKELENTERNSQGLVKAKYAEMIATEIIDKYIFSVLFENELDFLIK